MKEIMAIVVALTTTASAATVEIRDTNKRSETTHGYVEANGKKVEATVDVYGSDAIAEAHRFGRYTADINIAFQDAVSRIASKASELYSGHPHMIRWFEGDAAAAYDAEKREMHR